MKDGDGPSGGPGSGASWSLGWIGVSSLVMGVFASMIVVSGGPSTKADGAPTVGVVPDPLHAEVRTIAAQVATHAVRRRLTTHLPLAIGASYGSIELDPAASK